MRDERCYTVLKLISERKRVILSRHEVAGEGSSDVRFFAEDALRESAQNDMNVRNDVKRLRIVI